jgi:hypothetical protein
LKHLNFAFLYFAAACSRFGSVPKSPYLFFAAAFPILLVSITGFVFSHTEVSPRQLHLVKCPSQTFLHFSVTRVQSAPSEDKIPLCYLRPQLLVIADLDQVLDFGVENGQYLGLQYFCRLLHQNDCWADDRKNVGVHGRSLQARDSDTPLRLFQDSETILRLVQVNSIVHSHSSKVTYFKADHMHVKQVRR